MPNTDSFQIHPDSFGSREEGKRCPRENTNPRYKFFRQTHFTAGDYDQFLAYWDKTSHKKTIEIKTKTFPRQVDCPIYRDVSTDDVIQTFEYIFHKFKKGIFVKIVDNELRVFLPFSKVDYTNEWSDQIRIDPVKYPRGVISLLSESARLSGYQLDTSRVHFMTDHWYANNGLIRYEYPISENDSGVSTLRDMLLTLTKERDVPDVEFFINKRDFPILRSDGMEAYECLFGENHPLVSHRYPKYCPILGMATTDRHADIPIPTWDDWARVSYPTKLFGKDFCEYPDPFVGDYHSKRDTAVFRGASTGLGVVPETNPRLKYALKSLEGVVDEDGVPFLDCGITKWNCRPRRCSSSHFYDCISQELMEKIPVADFLSYREQATYKFILHLPGHSEAYRLSMELAMGSVVLLYPCKYKLWYSHLLKPYVHYVPLKEDDVFEKIRWCKSHAIECEEIARNARAFYETVLSRDAILDHLRDLLGVVQTRAGLVQYSPTSMTDFLYTLQSSHLQLETRILRAIRSFPTVDTSIDLSRLHPRTFQIILHQVDPEVILRMIRDAPVIKKSRSVSLRKIILGNRALCVKTSHTPKDDEIAHECFVGQLGMNRVANVCPMIVYTYGRWENHVITEFVEGSTLETSLHEMSSQQVLPFFVSILYQLAMLLQFLQTEYGFIHYDLYPWNIIICKNVDRRTFVLPVQGGKSFRYTPEYYPVLIDFGKSHIVYQNTHFVRVEPFHMNLHQDILSILISGLFILVQFHKLSPDNIKRVIRLVNYMSRTSFTHFKVFDNLNQIKAFLRMKKKYSNMLLNDKSAFSRVEPVRFQSFLETHFRGFLSDGEVVSDLDLILSSEIYFSRFFCIDETCRIARIETSICDPTDIFYQDHDPFKKSSVNTVTNLYRMFIDYLMVSRYFRRRDPQVIMSRIVDAIATQKWSIKNEAAPAPGLVLPRFFSHPNIRLLETQELSRSSNHFFEKHKMLGILWRASSHYSELGSLKGVLESIPTTRYYLSSLLGDNLHHSTSNHLHRFRTHIKTT